MRCKACNKNMTNKEIIIDDELCTKCLGSANEALIELEESYEERRRSNIYKK